MYLAVIFTAITFGLHGQWSAYTSDQLRQQVEALRAAGQPMLVEDFNRERAARAPSVGDDLEKTLQVLKDNPSEAMGFLEDCEEVSLPLTDAEREHIRQAEKDHANVLAAIEAAGAAKSVGVTKPLKSPVFDEALSDSFNSTRTAAQLIGFVVREDVSAKQFGAAVRRTGQIETLARVASSNDSLVATLVADGIRALQADLYREISTTIAIGAGPHDAAPQDLRTTIAALYDQSAVAADLLRAYQFERMFQLDTITSMGRGTMKSRNGNDSFREPLVRYTVRPFLNCNAMACVTIMTEIAGNTSAADLPAYRGSIHAPHLADLERGERTPMNMLASILVPSLRRPADTRYRIQTEREAAAAALAIRWYASDHGNKLPAKLDELVPKYLPRLPRDYVADNKPLGYRAGEKPILWSVGENGVDNGGTEPDPQISFKERRETSDAVYPLYLKPRTAHD